MLPPAGKLKILIGEDHTTVLEGIKLLLNAQPDMEVIAEAGDGREAVMAAQTHHPDLAVLDVSMPGMNGLKAAETIRHTCPHTKILMLTRHRESAYVRQLLRAGASGYVLKQSRASELLNAVRAVAGGGVYVDPTIVGDLVVDTQTRTSGPRSAETPRLSQRESDVLRLIAIGNSNKEIAAQLGLSVKTIETHKANAMAKLGMHSRIDIVRFAMLQGWLDDV
jgi:DNA-binding NarL/FixJ family response regulator